MAQIVGGAIAFGVSRGLEQHPIGVASWKFLFIIVGAATFLYGILMWFFLPDSPLSAKWLNDEEKHIVVERIRGNQQGIGSKIFKWYQVREAFTDFRVRHVLGSNRASINSSLTNLRRHILTSSALLRSTFPMEA